ncbi:hypothetical protein pVco14_086 [Vibrio phage pVco-14]|nr:hypothetical protein pVco14_086 [Vibrio phage pVco-14]
MKKLALILALAAPLANASLDLGSPALVENVGMCTAYLKEIGITHTPLVDTNDQVYKAIYQMGFQFATDEMGFSLKPVSELYNDRKCHRILAQEKQAYRNEQIKKSRK